jgi:hypothetical protein
MRKFYYTILFCSLLVQALAQTDSLRRAAPVEEAAAVPRSIFTIGAIYGNTENYYGQSPEQKYPYILSYAGYRTKAGVSFSVTAEKLLSSGTGIAVVDMYAGYSFDITKKLSGSVGYSRYFYQKNSPLLGTANENNLNTSISYKWFIKTALSSNYSFGNQNDVFLSFRNSKMIDLGSLFSDKDYVSIEPTIDAIAGTGYFYDDYTERTNNRRDANNKPPPPPPPPREDASTFGILTYTFSLPIAYNRASYTVEATYQGSIQGTKFSSTLNKPVSIFNLAFYYAF